MDALIVGLIALAAVGYIVYKKRDILLSKWQKKEPGSVPLTPDELAKK